MTEYFNNTKNRKATPNEIAKYLILDAAYMATLILDDKLGLEDATQHEKDEIIRFGDKHYNGLVSKYNLDDIIIL